MKDKTTKLAWNVKTSSQLPNQLVIRKGRVVMKSTGKPPTFPSCLEGQAVNVVPHDDLVRVLNQKHECVVTLNTIASLINMLRQEAP